jgi:alpha-L-fucosidase
MTLDRTPVKTGETLELARGNHLLVLSGASNTRQLEWQLPGASTYQKIDDRRLFAAPDGGNGLEATFYPTQTFEGSPVVRIIDPILAHYYHVTPFAFLNLSPAQWSAEWQGEIDVPTDGTYRFDAERLSRAGLWLDGASAPVFDDTLDLPSASNSGTVQLSAGRHPIRVRFQQRGDGGPHLYLYWTPPGGARQLVPGSVLYPPAPAAP